jgi:hypothetical protein
MHDCKTKGRIKGGDGVNWRIKLSLEKAREIRSLWGTGVYSKNKLSEKYDIATKHIRTILNNLCWKE